MMDLPFGFQANLGLRYVSSLPEPKVPYYAAVDAALAWMWRNLEVTLSGNDLSERRHAEFGAAPIRQEVPRSVAGRIGARF
jgi:iron complex outermembrane receptor protein